MGSPARSIEAIARVVLTTPFALAPILVSMLAFAMPGGWTASPEAARPLPIERMEVRAALLSRGIGTLEEYYEARVAPVEHVLSRYHEDQAFVRSVSLALVSEGERLGVDPRALASVLLVENPWLDPDATSFMGAVGLMQVMPFHAGRWGCASDDLTDVKTNICHGARIFAAYMTQHHGDVDRALLAYNGCVLGTNTPDCHLYPSHVYSNAGRVFMRYWLETP